MPKKSPPKNTQKAPTARNAERARKSYSPSEVDPRCADRKHAETALLWALRSHPKMALAEIIATAVRHGYETDGVRPLYDADLAIAFRRIAVAHREVPESMLGQRENPTGGQQP